MKARGAKLRANKQELDKCGAEQGERADDREALVTKVRRRYTLCEQWPILELLNVKDA